MRTAASFALDTGATASSGALKPRFQLPPLEIRSRSDDLPDIAPEEYPVVSSVQERGYYEGLNYCGARGITDHLSKKSLTPDSVILPVCSCRGMNS